MIKWVLAINRTRVGLRGKGIVPTAIGLPGRYSGCGRGRHDLWLDRRAINARIRSRKLMPSVQSPTNCPHWIHPPTTEPTTAKKLMAKRTGRKRKQKRN